MATADAVNNIIQALNETDEQPRKQIAEIVDVLGDDVALGLLNEVKSVQDTGGLAVRDGTRQRTPGGVFFSLAKAKLPKADRNRIFRLRPPKPVVAEAPPSEPTRAATPAPKPPREDDGRRRIVEFSAAPKGGPAIGGGAGRRRVVDVEVLRQNPKPSPPPVPLVAVRESSSAPNPAPARADADARPLRRIVTLGPREEPPPTTPEAAVDRVRSVLRALGESDRRRVLSDLLTELGPEKTPPPAKVAEPPRTDVSPALRERVLASVTEALGLSTSDLARVLYGDDGAGPRNKARAALERWRRSE